MNLSLIQISRPLSTLSASFRHLSLSSSLSVSVPGKDEIPKNPNTPGVNYYTKSIPSSKKAFPNLRTGELMRKISTEWKKLPEKEKGKFQEIYKTEKLIYAKKLESLPKGVLEERKKSKKVENDDKKMIKDKRSAEADLRNLLTSLKKPKKNLTTFFLYCKDRRPQLATSLSSTDKIKQMAEEWNNSNAKIKELYEKKEKALAVNYTQEMEKWSMRMHEQGKTEEIAMAQMKVNKTRKFAKDNSTNQ